MSVGDELCNSLFYDVARMRRYAILLREWKSNPPSPLVTDMEHLADGLDDLIVRIRRFEHGRDQLALPRPKETP